MANCGVNDSYLIIILSKWNSTIAKLIVAPNYITTDTLAKVKLI